MKALFRHPLRLIGRLLWMNFEFVVITVVFIRRCGFRPSRATTQARAEWLQYATRRFLHIFSATIRTSGPVPTRGLLVCNHLSYVDILVLASLTPAVFVAKREVKSWPVFGWFAQLAGTLFVDRQRRSTVGHTTNEIEAALNLGALVIIFPEGTSSGGATVLPFKSSLLEPATRPTGSLFAGRIQYEIDDGDVSEEVCYWKDMTLLPHLLNLLSKRTVRATVRFSQVPAPSPDRKELARQLHAEVSGLGK